MTTNDVIKAIDDFKNEQKKMQSDILRLEQTLNIFISMLASDDKVAIAKVQPKEEKAPQTTNEYVNVEKMATEYLHRIGAPAHVKGYQYLKVAIVIAVKDEGAISGITKYIYPDIARKYKTTSSRVERAIRHVIETVWQRGNVEYLKEMFGYSVDPNQCCQLKKR